MPGAKLINFTTPLLGVPISTLPIEGVMQIVADRIESGERPAGFIVQTNVYSLVTAQERTEYRNALLSADICVPDGRPLTWMLCLKGLPRASHLRGADVMLALCRMASSKGWRCFLYGGKQGTPEKLQDFLQSRFPALQIVGTYSPPFRPLTTKEENDICCLINEAKPDIVWVGLGSPKQDLWMHEHAGKLDVSIMHGVGAAFDFFTGEVPQAPKWMQRAGLEWTFRLLNEPTRLWRRYTITNIRFMFYLFSRELLKARCYRNGQGRDARGKRNHPFDPA